MFLFAPRVFNLFFFVILCTFFFRFRITIYVFLLSLVVVVCSNNNVGTATFKLGWKTGKKQKTKKGLRKSDIFWGEGSRFIIIIMIISREKEDYDMVWKTAGKGNLILNRYSCIIFHSCIMYETKVSILR